MYKKITFIYIRTLIYPTLCCGDLCSAEIPVEHTADRIPRCCHHVLKQCQCELQVIVGDGSETATIIPNE